MSFHFSKEAATIPLVVGVTGHRDLRNEDIPKIKEKIKFFLNELINRYINTPIIILSPLAEGADTLVAQTALELKEKGSIRLIVPLPFEKEEYEKTFTEESNHKQIFEDLLDVADDFFVNPLYEEFINSEGYHKNNQDKYYALLGNYIAKSCHILFALWNGIDNEAIGGTAHVVKSRLFGNKPYIQFSQHSTKDKRYIPLTEALDIYDTGVVYQLVTKRNKTELVIGEPFSGHYKYPSYVSHTKEEVMALFEETFINIDEYNKQVLTKRLDFRNSSKGFLNITHRNGMVETFNTESIPPPLMRLLHKYFGADTLASYHMKKRRKTLDILTILGIASLSFFQLYGYTSFKWLLLTYVLLSLISIAYYHKQKKSADNYSLDYRALAEGLRIQFFCRFIGLKKSLSDQYLKQRNELQWISYAIQGCNLDSVLSKTPTFSLISIRKVLTFFVISQIDYFEKRIDKDKKIRMKYDTAFAVCFGTAIICNFIAIVLAVVGIGPVLTFDMTLFGKELVLNLDKAFFITSASILIVFSVGLRALFDKKAYEPNIRANQHMLVIYKEAYEHLSQLLENWTILEHRINEENMEDLRNEAEQEKKDYEKKIQEFIVNLGIESLKENAWWAIINHDKKTEVVKG